MSDKFDLYIEKEFVFRSIDGRTRNNNNDKEGFMYHHHKVALLMTMIAAPHAIVRNTAYLIFRNCGTSTSITKSEPQGASPRYMQLQTA